MLDWAALYLKDELGASTFVSGLGFAFFAGTMAIMRFAGDSVRNRFGAVATLRLSGAIGAAGLLIGAFAPTPGLAIAGFRACRAWRGQHGADPVLGRRELSGTGPGAAISAVTMVGYAGILVAPASIGFIATHLGYRPTYAGLAVLLLVVSALAGRTAMADARQDAPGAAAPAR